MSRIAEPRASRPVKVKGVKPVVSIEQPGALGGRRAFGEAGALEADRRAVDDDGGGDAVGARAEEQGAAAAGLQVVDRRLDGRRVVRGAVALGAVVAHMRAAVGEQGAAELRDGGAPGLDAAAPVGLHQRREVRVGGEGGEGEFADPGVGHGGSVPERASRRQPRWGSGSRRRWLAGRRAAAAARYWTRRPPASVSSVVSSSSSSSLRSGPTLKERDDGRHVGVVRVLGLDAVAGADRRRPEARGRAAVGDRDGLRRAARPRRRCRRR